MQEFDGASLAFAIVRLQTDFNHNIVISHGDVRSQNRLQDDIAHVSSIPDRQDVNRSALQGHRQFPRVRAIKIVVDDIGRDEDCREWLLLPIAIELLEDRREIGRESCLVVGISIFLSLPPERDPG